MFEGINISLNLSFEYSSFAITLLSKTENNYRVSSGIYLFKTSICYHFPRHSNSCEITYAVHSQAKFIFLNNLHPHGLSCLLCYVKFNLVKIYKEEAYHTFYLSHITVGNLNEFFNDLYHKQKS